MHEGRTIIVTGSSGGIGREIALRLLDEGANVVLAARSDGIEETATLADADDRALPYRTDVTDETAVESVIDKTITAFGGLDGVVNNAGIAGPTAPVTEIDASDWNRTMAVNAMGPFFVAKHATPHLVESERASIVNISSISGKRPLENRTPYTASKMAVIGLTRTLAFELGDDDVTVNAVCPGPTAGPRIERVIENQAEQRGLSYEEAKRAVFADDAALGELVDPEDVAEAVSFLLGPNARQITAQDINVDGGTVWY
ncbi:NAD(P)-dependent dehydrogenase, short-chain alcohol dehydrogenase family [Natronorubrum sediminis]|uniref:NAD(P)-dependent dehydrogenase, short-chain alcohol dehydrogenase family n=1 Tax=Natronorubrum sediminis TaxID=640943 RepID=A0A1H6G5F1_9EURY|nr:SDR family oxidoreductase [Natronorubrum sediminis]SEH17850.1 NAD(P)-dependent dehydrogenase, short-chain alcohol dehydrogenase family [Natronorubrum sediminis]